MIEFEWEKKGRRAEAAALLRDLAASLDGDGPIELETSGWELRLDAADQVAIEIEVKVDGDETELEVELKWSRPAAAAKKEPQAKG
jgi:amphi-Trp domain-containing protein